MLFLHTADDHDVRFDLAVRLKRGFAVTPAFVCTNVFVDAEICH
jgi:hypothetical protein